MIKAEAPPRPLMPDWLSQPPSLVWATLSSLLVLISTWIAWQQNPHPNAYRPEPSCCSYEFWAYPLEQNAFKRLPQINGNLNDVFALGDQVWAVGDEGLIVHSHDGGITWERQTVAKPAAETQSSLWDWLGVAWAGEPPIKTANQNAQQSLEPPQSKGLDSYTDAPAKQQSQSPPPTEQNISNNLPSTEISDSVAQPELEKPLLTDNTANKINITAGSIADKNQSAIPTNKTVEPQKNQSDTPPPKQNTVIPPTSQSSDFQQDLSSIFFVDTQQGWAVGDNGTILATTNGGQTWQTQSSDTQQRLIGIAFSDAQHGWAVGDNGTILATTNGGHTWQTQSSGISRELSSVSFSDPDHGWAVGDYGMILATENGGQTWQIQDSGSSEDTQPVSIDFSDSRHGWAVSYGRAILATKDGGQTWQAQASSSSKSLVSIDFSDPRHGWAVGYSGAIIATRDGGQTWQAQISGTSQDLSSVSFSDPQHGWVVGQDGTILATRDGGQTWQTQASGKSQTFPSVSFSDPQHGWVLGWLGSILTTQDGGQTWQTQGNGSKWYLYGVSFNDPKHGWMVGYKKILSTRDGGKTWQTQEDNSLRDFIGVSFSDLQHGWMVSWDNTILSTRDGGQTWQAHAIDLSQELYGVSFTDPQRGWVVGKNGTILTTRDGGQTWQTQTSGTSQDLYGASFTDPQRGWVVGKNGTILATRDGGQTWQTQTSGTQQFLCDVSFSDPQHGWVVSKNGAILATRDGGQTWQAVDYQRYPAPWFYPILFAALAGYWQAFRSRINEQKQGKTALSPRKLSNRVITDQPAGPGSADLLGARQIALGLTRFLTNENTQPPLTIAITGEWGSGKSSVMNYLRANLKREGLSPVWFNAWHHRDEQNVLASILANVHKQAIKAWWQPQGFWFRLRMLWRRHWLLKTVLLASLFASMFLFGWLSQTPGKWQEAMHYALYLAKIEQPVILSDRSVKQLCPSLSSSQENAKAGSTEKAKDWFTAEQCKDLQGLASGTSSSRNDLRCAEGIAEFDTNRCFATPDVLLAALEKRMDLKLSTEDEATILKTVEHLHPDSPVPVPFESWVKWVSALLGVLAIFVVKGMTVVGLAPNQVVQTVFKQAGISSQSGEKVGTRLWCESHFKIITQLLGRRRLVLFIDDLDRCDRDFTRQLLEATNFLSNAGKLFMVMGMAPRYVLANVTLSFEETAEAVDEVDKLNDDQHPGHDPTVGQSWFARHYLQKLIHIEVPVPKPETAQVLALLTSDGNTSETDNELLKAEQLERQIDLAQAWFWKICRILAVVFAIGGGYYLGTHPLSSQSVITETSAQPQAPEAAAGNTPPQTITEIPQPTPESNEKPKGEAFQPGFDDRNIKNWPIWTSLGLLLLLLAGGFGLSKWMQRPPKWLDTPWLAWLQPLWKRTKVAMLGPESSQDTKDFVDALEIWHGLIAAKNPTPRTLKAFVNRLRYFASRDTGQSGNGREAQLVALAAIYYVYPEEFESIIGLMQLHFSDPARPSKLGFENQWPAIAMAAGQHERSFGSIPSQQDIDFFRALNEDICIHRPD